MKYLISGGGTGGHIFPAISIANELREREPGCEILFIGANDRMEMTRVPEAGYDIVGLRVQGLDRKHILRNVSVLWHLAGSMLRVRRIIRRFRPDVAIGVGGYASGAALRVAEQMGIPVVLQEQNSYAGVTNKMLARKARRICVAYTGMERFFPADKIVITGNPVRQNLFSHGMTREQAIAYFHLDPVRPVLLVIGGSLGARTINRSIADRLDDIARAGIQLIWQTGKHYIDECRPLAEPYQASGITATDFVSRMDLAYAAASLVISRAGASSISELCLLGKPAILVPSPNVAEDHQTHNARALSDRGAAVFVSDADAPAALVDQAISLIHDDARLEGLSREILRLALPNAASLIADEIQKISHRV